MAKLTRYSSFEELKADAPAAKVTPKKRDKVHADFEEFIKLLQRQLATENKNKPSHE